MKKRDTSFKYPFKDFVCDFFGHYLEGIKHHLPRFIPMKTNIDKVPEANSLEVKIDPSVQNQIFEGWGTSLCWWAGQIGAWSEPKRSDIMNDIFGESGLRLSKIRYNIGGGENPLHNHMIHGRQMEGFINPDGTYDWSRDEAQRWVARNSVNKGVDDIVAFNNSAPWFMTKSGCASGSKAGIASNLPRAKENDFVNYMADSVAHLKEKDGIPINKVVMVNEPLSCSWAKGGTQEGMRVFTDQLVRLNEEIRPALDKRGHAEIDVVASDTWSIDEMVIQVNHRFDKPAKDIIKRYDFHSYSGKKRYEMAAAGRRDKKPVYMTEFCHGTVGHTHKAMNSSIEVAKKIVTDLKEADAMAWYIWQAVESEEANVKTNQDWGLMHGVYRNFSHEGKDYIKEDCYKSKQYYAMGQFSRHIPKGSIIIGSNNKNILAAFDKKQKKAIIVAINPYLKDLEYKFDLSDFSTIATKTSKIVRTSPNEAWNELAEISLNDKHFSDKIPANSVVTYEIDDAEYLGEKCKSFDGLGFYKIVNKNSDKVMTVEKPSLEEGIKICQTKRPKRIQSGLENWNIRPSGDGRTYIIKNQYTGRCLGVSGKNPLVNGELLEQTADVHNLKAKWLVIDNGDGHHRLINAYSGKSPTIVRRSKFEGARVNQWTFSTRDNSLWKIEKV